MLEGRGWRGWFALAVQRHRHGGRLREINGAADTQRPGNLAGEVLRQLIDGARLIEIALAPLLPRALLVLRVVAGAARLIDFVEPGGGDFAALTHTGQADRAPLVAGATVPRLRL